MIGPRKGPEISWRAVLEGNRDRVRGDAVDVKSRRNRQVGAFEGVSDPAANEAVGAVRPNDPWCTGRVAARRNLPLAAIPHDLAYSFRPPHDARVKGGLEQRAVKGHARRHGEVGSGIGRFENDLRAARPVFEGDVFDRYRTNRPWIDRV